LLPPKRKSVRNRRNPDQGNPKLERFYCKFVSSNKPRRIVLLFVCVLLVRAAAQGKHPRGSGAVEAPYQTAGYSDLRALADEGNDCDKRCLLMADIDLDPR
jgi:hypothetical protein